MTRLLVLGGTRHVGRAAVEHAVAAGWQVTTVNRGSAGADHPGVTALRADRTQSGALAEVLEAHGDWDVVLDTWSGDPWVVDDSSRLLHSRAAVCAYVSSVSVYTWPWPLGVTEEAPVVDGDPRARDAEYAEAKRGAELAVLEAFGSDRSILARAGLILGPYEQVGRLPWWLQRVSAGGRLLVPGPPERPLQFIDGRDLAGWLLASAAAGHRGPVNIVGPPGMMTTGEFVTWARTATGSSIEFDWLTVEQVESTGLEPWTQFPIWTPAEGEYACVHAVDVTRALGWGLQTRPAQETIADTWAWLQAEGYPASVTEGRIGFDRATEDAARATLGLRSGG